MRSDFVIPHLQLREQFRDEQSVIRNGWTVVGAPTINDGIGGFTTTDYLERKITFNTNISIFIQLTPEDSGGSYSRILDCATQQLRILWSAASFTFYINPVIGGVSRIVSILDDLSPRYGEIVSIGFSIENSGGNFTLRSYLDGVLKQQNGPYAGNFVIDDSPYRLGAREDSANNPYLGSIYDFQIFNEVFTEEDFLQLHNDTLTSDLQPEKSRIILPGNRQWNNGSGDRVTPALGTVITEAELGDGTSSATFPTLEDNRTFSFDGGDYINCGHDNNFNFTINQPFTIGCMFYLGSGTSTNTIMGKWLNFQNGEWSLYVVGIRRPLMILLDTDNVGYRYWIGSNGDLVANSWHSFICCYDGSGGLALSNAQVYINGVNKVVSTNTDGTTFVNMRGGSDNLVIGGRSNGTTLLQAGNKVSLPFIFPTCLSPLQVKIMHEKMKLWRMIP